MFNILHDEHAFHIKPQAMFRLTVIKIERRPARNKQQLGVFRSPFDPIVRPGEGILIIRTGMTVKGLVGVIVEFGL